LVNESRWRQSQIRATPTKQQMRQVN